MAVGNAERKHIVLITHGIISQGGVWAEDYRKALQESGLDAQVLGYPTAYLLKFWMPECLNKIMPAGMTRESAVQHLLKEIVSYPADKYELSVIAHSFGTWIIANIMRKYPAIRFRRVAFIGSVVSDEFPWNEIINRNIDIDCVLNSVGRKDPWPTTANIVTWGYGPTGTFGFRKAHIFDKFHDVSHSGLLTYEFARDYLAPFLADGTVEEPQTESEEHWLPKVLDCFKWVKWTGLVMLLVVLCLLGLLAIASYLPKPVAAAPVELIPEWKTWDKVNETIKPNDSAARKLQVRLDKWKEYFAEGAQPWLAPTEVVPEGVDSNATVPAEPTMGFGWFEKKLADQDIPTFTFAFEVKNRNVAIKEVYAFLSDNLDSSGYSPTYSQMKPSIDEHLQELEIRGYKGGQKLLCFVIVASQDDKGISSDPSAWGIQLRRK